ncbi:MAG: NUDIX domain-containing protein [Clostridia bacterium]|nr:NUDIX domain-containing protein [Clostridia bacterium]
MMSVDFYEEARDSDLKFAVIAARYEGKWLMCRQKGKDTWELPGGHREEGEGIHTAARRELWEETGAREFQLEPVAAYSYEYEGRKDFGALFFANIWEMGEPPEEFEIEEIKLFETLPKAMSYPTIQPFLMERIELWLKEGSFRSQLDDMMEIVM